MKWIPLPAVLVSLCCTACVPVDFLLWDARQLEAREALADGQRLQAAGRYAEAAPLLERALAAQEEAFGGHHPNVVPSLNSLGIVYTRQGHFEKAEALFQRALRILEREYGRNHPDVAAVLHNLANLYEDQEQYARAEPLSRRAVAIRERTLGRAHPDVATSLNTLAIIAWRQGDFDQAEQLFKRVLAIRERALGGSHPDFAASLNNLANLYRDQGLYTWAEPLLQRALELQEKALGKTHPDIADTLNNLGSLYTRLGHYALAEPLLQRAVEIRELVLGGSHPRLADALYNLGLSYEDQGYSTRAEPLYRRAIEIQEAAFGEDHPRVANMINSLGALLERQGKVEQAELLYQRALATMEATLGEHHPGIAHPLNNLANLLLDQKQYTRAEALYRRALEIWRTALGENHPDVAIALNNLAILYERQGMYARAESLHQRTLQIREAAYGKHHPDVAGALYNLARFYLAQQQFGEALSLFERSFESSEELLRQGAFGFSEASLSHTLHRIQSEERRLYLLTYAQPVKARAQRLALAAALVRKGRSAEELTHTSLIIHRGLGEAEREAFERLRALRTRFSTLALAGPGGLSMEDYQQRLGELSDQSAALEAELARSSEPLRAFAALPPFAEIIDKVAAALPEDGVLVEFVAHCHCLPPVHRPGGPQPAGPQELRYLALLLFPDGRTDAVDLGPASPIDDDVRRLHHALASRSASYQPAARELHARVFSPLLPALGNVRHLFLAPDGQLSLIPFAALHDGRRFLLDSFDITYLTSGKDLLPRHAEPPSSRSIVVMADPDFGATPPAAPSSPQVESASLQRFFSSQRAEEADLPWPPLPGTRKEAEALQRLFPHARLLLGSAASKHALLTLETPHILHIATHGFFLPDPSAPQGSRAVVSLGPIQGDGPPRIPPEPLLRSGLVLAGALAPTSPSSPPRREDFLVTALELAGLDLWGTQLVVLSACDTGRGDITLGQGVFGLRRALVLAGAETLVTTLWKVKDDTTPHLMEAYYRHLLAGQGRSSALRQAMRELRETHPHPYFWAPFIAIGQHAPLREPLP